LILFLHAFKSRSLSGFWSNPHLAPHLISLGVWLRASVLKLARPPGLQPLSFPTAQYHPVHYPGVGRRPLHRPSFLKPQSRTPCAYAMTVSFLPPRAFALRLLSRGPSTPVLLSSLRVKHDQNVGHRTSPSYSNVEPIYLRLGQIQNYATDVPTSRPGRPKAHTGRATASKRKPAASISSSTSAAPKSTAAKKAAKTKKKTKTKAKPKPKPKPKRKTRVLTEQQKQNKKEKAAALKQRNLRITALLTPPSATPPKQLPRTAYMVINAENQVKGTATTDIARASAAKYKALTPEEREVRC